LINDVIALAITHKNCVVQAKIIKRHSIAISVNIKSPPITLTQAISRFQNSFTALSDG